MGIKRPLVWIRGGGTVLCLLLGISTEFPFYIQPGASPVWISVLSLALHVGFAFMFRTTTRDFPANRPWHAPLLAAQLTTGAVLGPDMAIFSAVAIPLVIPSNRWARWIVALLAALTAGWVTLFTRHALAAGSELKKLIDTRLGDLAASMSIDFVESLAWVLLALFMAVLVARTEADRRELAALNAELLSSRAMLAESSRMSERLHIARELHDSLGHHLTTLNLNLEIARHLPSGDKENQKDTQIEKAQFLARLLLADLRDTVSTWRKEEFVALPEALRALTSGASGLAIDLDIEADLPPLDPASAHVILRCAQEALTNVLRHASASKAAISLRRQDGHLSLTVTDNGRGCDCIIQGNGLSGIVGRAAERSGRSSVESAGAGKGFTVRVELPFAGGAA